MSHDATDWMDPDRIACTPADSEDLALDSAPGYAALAAVRRRCCSLCPARAECMTYGIERGETGVYGGEFLHRGRVVAITPPKTRRTSIVSDLLASSARENIASVNDQHTAEAAARACGLFRRALAVLPDGTLTALQAEAARLRLAHPRLSIPELAEKATPPVSRHAMVSRLRGALSVAERALSAEGAVA